MFRPIPLNIRKRNLQELKKIQKLVRKDPDKAIFWGKLKRDDEMAVIT